MREPDGASERHTHDTHRKRQFTAGRERDVHQDWIRHRALPRVGQLSSPKASSSEEISPKKLRQAPAVSYARVLAVRPIRNRAGCLADCRGTAACLVAVVVDHCRSDWRSGQTSATARVVGGCSREYSPGMAKAEADCNFTGPAFHYRLLGGYGPSMRTVGIANSSSCVHSSLGRWRRLRMAPTRTGCCTLLLFRSAARTVFCCQPLVDAAYNSCGKVWPGGCRFPK